MRLREIKLRNFRCYENEFSVKFDDFTCLIGKNDIGKSTIFDALEIFFNTKKIDVDDKTKNSESNIVSITCVFDNLPDTIVIDASNETSLQNEYLLNNDGYLEITQEYKCAEKSAKLTQTFVTASHPSDDGINDLLELKIADLKKRAKDRSVDTTDIDTRVSALIRKAIWEAGQTESKDIREIPIDKEGAKQIWDSIQVFLPSFALFKSDRVSSDQDSEAQDPLKEAIKEATRSVEEQFTKIITQVETEVKKVADATLKKLNEMDPELTSTLNPIIKPKPLASLFSTSIVGDENIPLNKRGSGVRRLILLNFFRAKAEQYATDKNKHYVIYAVEEPETSQLSRAE
ncbi:MAG: ATP-binding protein [Robiginitomaculum sp.]|nr:ATP-binding protein [Robiginitomaculum sp.]